MTAMTDFSKDAKIFKALCDTKRLTILDYLKSGEKCACVLIENMNIGQSALSYHMKIVRYYAIPALFMQDKRENGHITA